MDDLDFEVAKMGLARAYFYDEVDDFITGYGPYMYYIKTPDGSWETTMIYSVHALYDTANKGQELEKGETVGTTTERILRTCFQKYTLAMDVYMGIKFVLYQLECEQKGISPFTMKNKELLELARENIARNCAKYEKSYFEIGCFKDRTMMEMFAEQDKEVQRWLQQL